MRDVLDDLVRWWAAGHSVGLATVVGTWRSAPRPPGTSMAVGPAGEAIGSVSGGCVEAAVYDLAVEIAGDPRRVPVLQRYGISHDDAFAAGLTCGGIIDVYVEQVSPGSFPELGDVAASIRSGIPVAVVTCVDPADSVRFGQRMVVWRDRTAGSFGSARLDGTVADDARGMLATGQTGALHYGSGELSVFVAAYAPAPRMIIFGAIDFAAAVARVGSFLGFHVTVCDARPVFATTRRFPDADQVIVDWPHRYLSTEAAAGRIDERTVLCVLTHDPKFDVPLLEVALRLPVAYVGAMGSRRTHADRLARLREAGLTDVELSRLRSPIGLDLGARTPEETAISVAAEIVAARWGGSGTALSIADGPIHRVEVERPGLGIVDVRPVPLTEAELTVGQRDHRGLVGARLPRRVVVGVRDEHG